MSRPDATTPPARDPDALLRWLPLAVWVVSLGNALLYLDRGWFPHDLGSVAHPAQRVLLGELPHRDFQDVYTGGLAFLNALAYLALGQTAMTARWVALAAYAAWVPAVWMVARTFTGGGAGLWVAAAATTLAAAWTLPMYAEGMPSWFNLFCATFALLALLRFREDGRRRWLFWAGVAGGVSILFKIIGLYTVAAGLVALVWMEDAGRPDASPGDARRADLAYRWLMTACALVLVGVVAGLVVRAMGPAGLLRFGVAAMAPGLVLVWVLRRPTGVSSWVRLRDLSAMALPFKVGVLAALVPFLALYAWSGALHDLYMGVFVLPQRRLADAAWGGLRGGFLGMAVAAVWVALVVWGPRLKGGAGRVLAAAAALAGGLALALSGVPRVYHALWQGLWWLPPFVAVAAAVMVVRGTREGRNRATPAFLALAAGLASLVEIPFAAPIYFFFAAPMLVLLALSVAGGGSRRWLLGALVLLLGFTGLRLNPGFVRYLGLQPTRHAQIQPLRIPRGGGLKVDAQAAQEMETVVGMVEALAPGPYIYATPDAPELYFLTGRRNPTPTLFEFLDPDGWGPDDVLDALDRYQVPLVIINRRPFFSDPVPDVLVAGLQSRYPMAREVGRFLVVWKAPSASSDPPASSLPAQDPPSP